MMKQKNRTSIIIIVALLALKFLQHQCITDVRTGYDSDVFAYDRSIRKHMADGRFYAAGRYYSDPISPWSIANKRYSGERQECPLFFVISDFPVQRRGNVRGRGHSAHDNATFELNDQTIAVPVDTPSSWFFSRFPKTKGDNVFILQSDLSLKSLPYRLENMEQIEDLEGTIIAAESNNYVTAMIAKLEEYKTANQSTHSITGSAGSE